MLTKPELLLRIAVPLALPFLSGELRAFPVFQ
jgi:hypothetical protein